MRRLFFLVFVPILLFASAVRSEINDYQKNIVMENMGNVPLGFTENQGQFHPDVLFKTSSGGVMVFFTGTGVTYVLSRETEASKQRRQEKRLRPDYHFQFMEDEEREFEHYALKVHFEGSSPKARVVGEDRLPWNNNYFIGNNPSKWRTDVPNYKRIRYENIYDGIDLVYYGNGKGLKYDFIVQPGADPKQIQLRYDGTSDIVPDENGELKVKTPFGNLIEREPVAFQDNGIKKIKAGYKLSVKSEGIFSFDVKSYDTFKALVIDPELIFSTLLGGSDSEDGLGLDIDNQGNAYVTGHTSSIDFPVTSGAYDTEYSNYDTFIVKFNNSGSGLLYSTFLGGNSQEYSSEIVVDSQGNVYITGLTSSSDFPTTGNAYDNSHNGGQDVFVVKINNIGNHLIYSTFIGGSNSDKGTGIKIYNGNVYISGSTTSSDFPVTGNAYNQEHKSGLNSDGFVCKLNNSGNDMVFSTFIGGCNDESLSDLALDKNQNIYLVGTTESYDFPVTSNAFDKILSGTSDAFVSKISSDGSVLVSSTYLGGTRWESGNGITMDRYGNICVTGCTESWGGFPATSGAFYDEPYFWNCNGYISIFSASLEKLLYSTYIGGGSNGGSDIEVDIQGNIYLAGWTTDLMPTTDDAISTRNWEDQDCDGFLYVLSSDGKYLLYGTYLRSYGDDWSRKVAIDHEDNFYCTGGTSGLLFPTTPGAFDDDYEEYNSQFFLMKFSPVLLTIKITYPNESDVAHEIFDEVEIRWNSMSKVGQTVRIDLCRNFYFYQIIDGNVPNTGNYLWRISRRIEPRSDYRIRVVCPTNVMIYDYSDHTFTIDPNSIVSDPKQYLALKIDSMFVPVIDGALNDGIWTGINVDSLDHGGTLGGYNTTWSQFTDNLVTWQAVWCEETNKLYVGIKIQDDIRGTFDNEPGSSNYNPAYDESLEFMTDGNYSGGEYWHEFGQAQYWRVTEENHRDLYNYPSVADYPQEYTGDAFVTAIQQGANGNWTCEAVFTIYYEYPQSLKNLQEGDFIGWDIWYNDSDDENYNGSYFGIDHQTGWNYQGKCWRYADLSGDLILGGKIALPYLLVLYPNDADLILYQGDVYSIQWQKYGNMGDFVKIDLYQNNLYHQTISESTENDCFYDWTIPEDQETGNGFQIKIISISDTTQCDFSNQSFSIKVKPELEITYPDTSDIVWKTGEVHTITWNCMGEVGESVKLELFKRGYYSHSIVDSTDNNGEYGWFIPVDLDTSSEYQIKIISLLDTTVFDFNNFCFTIKRIAQITLTNPDSEQVEWKTGESHTITWTSVGDVGDWIRLDLYRQEEYNQTITDSTENDGEYEWSVPTNLDSSSAYKIKIASKSDTTIYDFSDSSFTIKTETGVRGEPLIPLTTQLHPNYPNPFNPETIIKYQLSEPGDVRLEVYDLMGRKVKTLVNTRKKPGYYEVVWNGRDYSGHRVASGIYIYSINVTTKTDHFCKTMKMVLLK